MGSYIGKFLYEQDGKEIANPAPHPSPKIQQPREILRRKQKEIIDRRRRSEDPNSDPPDAQL